MPNRTENTKQLENKISDYSMQDIAKITGKSLSCVHSHFYYGEYKYGKSRLVRKEVFDNRRASGLNVTIED